MSNTEMLTQYQSAAKKKPKPKPTDKPKLPLDLNQGSCAYIETKNVPLNGKAIVDIKGCTTMTFYESFNSKDAKAVWNTNQPDNPWFAPTYPSQPNTSGLLVIANAVGTVESMLPYVKGTKFKLSNNVLDNRLSEYVLSAKNPKFTNEQVYMNVLSPILSMQIPALVNG